MMVDKVFDNNDRKTISKNGYNLQEHGDSAVDLQIHTD